MNGINLAGTCLLAKWHTVYRGQDFNLGFSMELVNQIKYVKRKDTRGEPIRSKVAMIISGAD